MAKRKVNTVKLGLFVIVALILFSYGLYRIGDPQNLFGNTIVLYTDFQEVKGLRPGNNVRYAGIRIGTVEEIEIVNDTTLRVKMRVDQSVGNYIKKDARTEVATNGLVGNMLVSISAGAGKMDWIEEGDFLKSRSKVEMNAMLDQLSQTNENIAQISKHLLSITQKIDEGEGSMSILINDPSLGENLIISTRNLKGVSAQLNDASRQVGALLSDADAGKGNLGYLLKDSSLQKQISTLSEELKDLLAEDTAPILDSLQTTTENLAQSSQALLKIMDNLDGDNSMAGLLLSDSLAAQNLRHILYNLEQGTAKFDTNMKALQSNWLLKKYFKKEAKKKTDKP